MSQFLLGGIYMRPGRTQTGMSSYRALYISFSAFTWDRPDNELRPVWLRLGFWTETGNSRTGLSSYRPHLNDNKSQTEFRNFKPVCFWVSDILFDETCHFVPKTGTKDFVPVSCKRLQKFHTVKSSYRSEFVPVSCKYPLRRNSDRRHENLANCWHSWLWNSDKGHGHPP